MGVPGAIGPYVDLVPLGEGGMGLVYRGRHRHSGATAAVKTVRVREEGLVQGLRREIQALAKIRHPGVVRIVEHGSEEGMPWYAMELLQGSTLRARLDEHVVNQPTTPIRRGGGGAARESGGVSLPLALRDASALVAKLCHALAYLHGEGIVHGDLKPENVLVTPQGDPVLVDFGLVRRYGAGGREELEVRSTYSGTLAYMAPEQIRGEGMDARVDLYALGVMLYELVTGRRPYPDANLVRAHLELPPPPLSTIVESVPPALEAIVMRLLEKDPSRRLGSAEDVAAALVPFGAPRRSAELPSPRAVLYQPRLVARSGLLARLEELLGQLAAPATHEASAGSAPRGRMLLVSGPAGSGKTRLGIEAARIAGEAGIFTMGGGCPPAERDGGRAPLGALRKPLQQLADRCREHGEPETVRLFGPLLHVLAPFEPALADVPGAAAHPSIEELPEVPARLRLLHGVTQTLEALTSRVPALLLLDDLHEADELAGALLRSWIEGGALDRMRLLVLASVRRGAVDAALEETLHSGSVERHEIEDLPLEAVGAMAAEMLAADQLPADATAALGRMSGGNPLLLSECLRAAVDDGLLVRDDAGAWRVEALASPAFLALRDRRLPAVLADRLSRLTREARRVAQARAILGRDADARLLGRVASLEEREALDGISELLRAGLLLERAPGRYGFANHAMGLVSLELLDGDGARRLHEAAADALESGDPGKDPELAAALARHREEAGQLERAREGYLAAARAATARHALAEAERLYRSAIRLGRGRDATGVAAKLELGGRVLRLTRPPEALDLLRAALEDAEALGMEREALEARRRCAMGEMDAGDMAAAERDFRQALADARRAGDRRVEGTILGTFALFQQAVGARAAARAGFEEALRIQREVHHRREEGVVLGNLATLCEEEGDDAGAQGLYEQALGIHREVGNRRFEGITSGNLGVLHSGRGDLAAAEPLLEEAVRLLGEVGDRRAEAMMRSNLALLHANLGRLQAARRVYLDVIATHRENGDPRFEAITRAYLANLERRAGDVDEAERLLDLAQPRLRAIGDRHYDAYCTIERAHLSLHRNDLVAASRHVRELEVTQASLHAGPGDPIARALERIRGAMAELAQGKELWRGERLAGIPPLLAAWVSRRTTDSREGRPPEGEEPERTSR